MILNNKEDPLIEKSHARMAIIPKQDVSREESTTKLKKYNKKSKLYKNIMTKLLGIFAPDFEMDCRSMAFAGGYLYSVEDLSSFVK